MTDQSGEDEPIAADRDIPSVARQGSGQRIMMALFLLMCLGAVGLVVWDDLRSKTQPTFVDTDPDSFEISRGSAGKPFIRPEPPKPDPAPVAAVQKPLVQATPAALRSPSSYDPLKAQRDAALHQEALRLAREQAARLQERLRSPQLIIGSNTTAPAPSGPVPLQGNPEGQSGSFYPAGPTENIDANQAFLDRYARSDFETVRAVQLGNLDTLVPQGTLIGGVLETAISSEVPGQVRAIVSEDIYSFDKTRLMIPRGSRLIGRYRSGLVTGQTRVFVIWERLLRSDGVSIQVGSIGTDALGRAGIGGVVDTHFLDRFGSAILLSLIDGAIVAAVESVENDTQAMIALNTGDDFTRAAEIALENSINIPPTIYVDQGARIKVFVGRDLDFSRVETRG